MSLPKSTVKMLAGIGFLALLASGCATNRSEVRIGVTATTNPETGRYAKISEVRDLRRFEVNPSNPSRESLGNADEIKDPAITGRAYARKRNGFGKALGDVFLPEGQSVSGVVADAARQALREKGYAVVEDGSPYYGGALPLSLDIEHFWTWIRPGFWALEMRAESDVVMKGEALLGAPSQPVHGEALINAQIAVESNWQEVSQKGLSDLVEKMKAKLRDPKN
ncbi:MAG: flagellar biosynthesis protein [Pseudomonadota bacterium]|nr:flagellar biosynthesis protein [Pseudomonadota bacterium]